MFETGSLPTELAVLSGLSGMGSHYIGQDSLKLDHFDSAFPVQAKTRPTIPVFKV